MTHSPLANPFILEAFDCDLWCPVAQTHFDVADIGSLRSILGQPRMTIPSYVAGTISTMQTW